MYIVYILIYILYDYYFGSLKRCSKWRAPFSNKSISRWGWKYLRIVTRVLWWYRGMRWPRTYISTEKQTWNIFTMIKTYVLNPRSAAKFSIWVFRCTKRMVIWICTKDMSMNSESQLFCIWWEESICVISVFSDCTTSR